MQLAIPWEMLAYYARLRFTGSEDLGATSELEANGWHD
jgi:hypothetical protein